ncbi:hypothetical protein FRC01_010809 [Tulasnella sp. 417]|nr:hypothetical protein FRC01_010809 [Tulasnella sp. 417]
MSPSSISSEDDIRFPANRRIRHITGLAVRNLTPFPKRDGVASTLSEASAASSKGIQQAYIPDDADLVLSQRRTRKISAASISTLRSLRAQDDLGIGASSFSGGTTIGEDSTPTPTRKRRTSKARPALAIPPSNSGQQTRRGRSSSQASLLNHLPQPSSPSSLRSPPFDISLFGSLAHHQHPTASSSASGSTLQRSLEKVLQVRLVETLFTLGPSEEAQSGHPETAAPPVKASTASSAPRSRSPPVLSQRQRGHAKTPTSISRSGHLQSPSSSSFSSTSRRSSSPATSRPTTPTPPSAPPILPAPFYVSTYHRPSTNPTWVGLEPEHEFSPSANSQSQKVLVTLWARVEDKASREAWRKSSPPDISGKGKAKEEGPLEGSSWQPVQHWDIDLTEAELLPEEYQTHPHRLPPNSLVIALGQPNKWYWLPPSRASRPSSRVDGHISDGDDQRQPTGSGVRLNSPSRDMFAKPLPPSRKGSRMGTTAQLQDIVRLVNLESVLADTRESTAAVLDSVDKMLAEDRRSVLAREESERSLYLAGLKSAKDGLLAQSKAAREAIEKRKAALETRRDMLEQGFELLARDQTSAALKRKEVDVAQNRVLDVDSKLNSQRMYLVRTLDFIFPIEPLSSQDLLFGILDVPLPLPLGPSDPAPPLSLATCPTVNEQTTATALGYAAQVVHMVSIYLGRVLPYPITYAASRSMIQDPISTMQGPRIFPLFSTGVETYRFEYGVFLLNKDIEILMSDKNLRALDMRHTLPNLKNLLLTLTNGTSEEQTPSSEPQQSSEPRAIDVTEVWQALDELPSSSATTDAPIPAVSQPPPESVNSTPRRQFLSPLAAMLRSKYITPASLQAYGFHNSEPTTASLADDSLISSPPPSTSSDASNSGSGSHEGSTESSGDGGEVETEEGADDDTRTERGVKTDGEQTDSNTPTPTATIKEPPLSNEASAKPSASSNEGGYSITGSVFSSLFWRTPAKKEPEKESNPTSTASLPVQNAIS